MTSWSLGFSAFPASNTRNEIDLQLVTENIRLSEKFLSFYKEITNAQHLYYLYYFIELRMVDFVLSN